MISMVEPLHSGNALRLFLEPPTGAIEWKILCKGSGTFSGVNDPLARVAYQGSDTVIVDTTALQNEVMAFYCPFYTDDGETWTQGAVASGTPKADYADHTTDVLSHLRQRLEDGLKVECERGNFMTELGYIQVYTAPPALEQNLRFPLVTVHLESEEPTDRGIGEMLDNDEFDSIGGDWRESEGWMSSVRISIVGWALNGDERIELRKAIRRIVIANLTVFEGFGWVQVSLSQQDMDSVNGEYPSPIYQVMNTFSCVAPVRVGGSVGAITDVNVTGG